jgi:3-keto-5-aminohexanoate cleavage enzyme
VIASYNEGAAVAHLHTRNADGTPGNSMTMLREIMDVVLDSCPDIILQPSSCESYVPGATHYSHASVQAMVDYFGARSGRYMESTIFTPVSYAAEELNGEAHLNIATEENTVKTIQYLQEHNIKPEFMNHNWEGIQNVKEWLIKPGILEKPFLMSMGPGMHNAAETHPDPWGAIYVLGMMKMMPEGSVVSLSAGGRNWLPLTVFAILMGVAGVRVGMEDHLWMYPHKNEKIKSSADETRKIATIARELGRDIASPEEARAILGISGSVR